MALDLRRFRRFTCNQTIQTGIMNPPMISQLVLPADIVSECGLDYFRLLDHSPLLLIKRSDVDLRPIHLPLLLLAMNYCVLIHLGGSCRDHAAG